MDHGSFPRYAHDRSPSSAGAGSPVVGAVVAACIAGLLGVLILAAAIATSARDGGGTTLSPAGDAPLSSSPSSPSTPTWRLASYRRAGFDKSFKADLIDELPTPPELVVFGGSRATRFEPSYLASLTGLSTFNCAVQCFRPEDAWAFSNYLYSRAPDTRLHCIIALQTRTFHDDTLRAGLLYDQRLASAFPPALVSRQKEARGRPPVKELLGVNRFLARGYLVRNRYDVTRERPGYSFQRHLDLYTRRLLPQHRWDGPLDGDALQDLLREDRPALQRPRRRAFDRRHALPAARPPRLQGRGLPEAPRPPHGVSPCRRTRCRFRVLDLTDIRTFGGRATWFYDGAHVTRQNAHQIARYAAAAAPECFK